MNKREIAKVLYLMSLDMDYNCDIEDMTIEIDGYEKELEQIEGIYLFYALVNIAQDNKEKMKKFINNLLTNENAYDML